METEVKERFIPLTFDLLFKSLFENNLVILKKFLINVLDLDIEEEECDIYLGSKELTVANFKEKNKTVDILVTINDAMVIDIEINRSKFEDVKERNLLYLNKIHSLALSRGEDPKDLSVKKYIQLNLNDKEQNIALGEDIFFIYSPKTKTFLSNNYCIQINYLDYYRKLYYNKFIKKTVADYWLALLTARNYSELEEMLSHVVDTDLKNKIMEDVIRLNNSEPIFTEYERQMLDELVRYKTQENARKDGFEEGRTEGLKLGFKEGIEQGIEQGLERGLEQGIEQNKLETIRKMLINNADYEFISNVSGKTLAEIKEIEKSIET